MNEEKTIIPANVKQIGSISGEGRIYMEDYACTYLKQYAAADPTKDKAAVLIGRECEHEGEKVLFISGVIQGKYTTRHNGISEPTEKTWQYVAKQMSLYFDGLDIVGWAYIQPGFEDYLSEGIMEYQRKNADRGLNVLYLCDPSEQLGSFFKWDGESSAFATVRGYLVYYDKNEGMHEYMLENKLKNIVKQDTATAFAKPDNSRDNVKTDVTTDEKITETVRGERARGRSRTAAEQRRLSNLLGSVSFVMLLISFVMGAGLIRSDERINTLEQKLDLLRNDVDGVQSVFASQNKAEETSVAETVTEISTQTASETVAEPITESGSTASADEYSYYTVEKGDTLLKICKNEYGSGSRVDEIMQLNDIDDPSRLFVGMELKLPRE